MRTVRLLSIDVTFRRLVHDAPLKNFPPKSTLRRRPETTSSATIRPFPIGMSKAPARPQRRLPSRRVAARRWAFTSICRSAAAAAISATSASTRARTPSPIASRVTSTRCCGDRRFTARRRSWPARRPRYVYFGGGTPSFLSIAQLTQLFTGLQKHFPWNECEEIAFESEPGTLTDDKLHALHELGVTRLEHRRGEFRRRNPPQQQPGASLQGDLSGLRSLARKAGFQQINIDLIAGMLERDRGQLAGVRAQGGRHGARMRDRSIRWRFPTTRASTRRCEQKGETRRARGRLADQAGVGRLRLLANWKRPATR